METMDAYAHALLGGADKLQQHAEPDPGAR